MLKIFDELEKYELKNIISKIQSPYERYTQKKSAQRGIGSLQSTQSPQNVESKKDEAFSFTPHLLDTLESVEPVLDSIPQGARVGFDCESDSLDLQEAQLVGFSFCFDGSNAYYVPVGHRYLGVGNQLNLQEAKSAISRIFTYPLIGHNLKFDLSLIYRTLGLEHNGKIYDSMILSWLYDSIAPVGLDKAN